MRQLRHDPRHFQRRAPAPVGVGAKDVLPSHPWTEISWSFAVWFAFQASL
jgi:hypothetical protein